MPQQTTFLQETKALLGETLFPVWEELCRFIDERYEMEHLWNYGGKQWQYEYKFRRGGKTLCALYAREDTIGVLVVLGKAEQEKFISQLSGFSGEVRALFEETPAYHDGKWLMLLPRDTSVLQDLERLLLLKRRPNRK